MYGYSYYEETVNRKVNRKILLNMYIQKSLYTQKQVQLPLLRLK